MKNIFLSILFIFSMNSYSSGTSKLLDFLVSNSGVKEILSKTGVSGSEAKQIENYISSALSSIGNKQVVTKGEFLDALSKLPTTGSDSNIRKELQLLLDKSEGELKKEDIVRAINNLIYLANRHGKSVVITCADCVSESLAKNGFKFTVENIKSTSTKKLLSDVIPNNPREMQNFITSRVRRFGLGDYSKVGPDLISPEEEKTFALFLGLMENGSSDMKRLTNSIKMVSTKNGKTDFFNKSDPNKFWRIISKDMSSSEVEGWITTLDEVAKVSEKEKISSEEAFYKILYKKAEGEPALMKKLKNIKSKRCFFK